MKNVTLKDYSKELMTAVNAGNDRAILKVCNDIVSRGKQLVKVESGNLRNSIGYKVFNMGDLNIDVTPNRGEGYVGAAADYSIYEEFGTLKRQKPLNPFMRPAIDAVTKGVKSGTTIKNILDNYVNKALPKS